MSQFASLRLPYADPTTPHEMYADCQVVGHHLHLPQTRATLDEDSKPPVHRPTTWHVPEQAAALGGSLHLHLN